MTVVSRGTRACSRREDGFSLIELIVVITIIGILASVVVVNFAGQDDNARIAAVRADFKNLKTACNMFKSDHRRWPDNLDELVNPPDDGKGPSTYLESGVPVDPWSQQPYEFEIIDKRVMLTSYGANQAQGGDGVDADITSDTIEK